MEEIHNCKAFLGAKRTLGSESFHHFIRGKCCGGRGRRHFYLQNWCQWITMRNSRMRPYWRQWGSQERQLECGQFERRVGYWRLRDRDMVSLPRTSIQNSIIKFSWHLSWRKRQYCLKRIIPAPFSYKLFLQNKTNKPAFRSSFLFILGSLLPI